MNNLIEANGIQFLDEMDAVRMNPTMYIGSVDQDGAHHLFFELLHNAIDESFFNDSPLIKIDIIKNQCTVSDNGRGIPFTIHEKFGSPIVELLLRKLHSGSKFNKKEKIFTAGLHGVGLSCVNALSEKLYISISKDGNRYEQSFSKGHASEYLITPIGAKEEITTKITFTPDPLIFREFKEFDTELIHKVVSELSFLYPKINFILNLNNITYSYKNERGISGLLDKEMEVTQALFTDPVHLKFENENLECEMVFNWSSDNNFSIKSFVNGVNTFHGGTHVNSFKKALHLSLGSLLEKNFKGKWLSDDLSIDDATDGVYCVLNLKLINPKYESQTKSRLSNNEYNQFLISNIAEKVIEYFSHNTRELSILAERITALKFSKNSAKRAAERILLQYGKKIINEEVYKKQFGERSKNWHSSAVWITHDELLKEHANHYELSSDAEALDVCCGSGVVGASFKGKVKKVYGLDLTPEMVALSKTRLDEVVQGNVYNIPFEDNRFDLVCTREVLHLLPYPEKPVSEIFRVLKPGGQFIVGQILPFSEVDGPWMYRIFKKKQPLIYNMFQEEDFRKMLLSAGFVDLKMTELNVWENIDVWINSYETTSLHRHEIREIYQNAPAEVREVHPFKILKNGEIHDLWRWCIFSVRKPLT